MLDALKFLAPESSPERAMGRFERLPAALRQRVLDEEQRTAYVAFQLPDLGYRHFLPTFRGWQEQLDQIEQSHPGMHLSLGGQAIQSGQIYAEFTSDLMNSLALAGLIIFGVLTAAFRSLRLGLISIVPNVLPLTGTAALLVAIDIPMAGATALVMSLGIAVDDTIHFLTRFRHEFSLDGDRDEAMRRSIVGVGKALILTTVVLVVGFASVMTSDFPRNRVFSGMICISLFLALASDLILLPAMLRLVVPRRGPVSGVSSQ
jgi:predicted RND superfamily exporter protein